MTWIKTIDYNDADPELKKIYDRVKGPDNNVDNVLQAHSLRPHTLKGHMTLYKNVLHNSNNTLPKWYLEALGVYVSYLNQCMYCVEHHFAGFRRLYNDDDAVERFRKAVKADQMDTFFGDRYLTGIEHAKQLTLQHSSITKDDVQELRNVGFSDGEILEINQVVSYFNYVNRSVIGLGVDKKGDILGLSPLDSDDPDNWNHE